MKLKRAFGQKSMSFTRHFYKKMLSVKRGRDDDCNDNTLLPRGFAVHVLSQPPIIACVAAYLTNLSDRSGFARACASFYWVLRKENPALNLMCTLWATDWIQAAERRIIIVKSKRVDCYAFLWCRLHPRRMRCAYSHDIELISQSGSVEMMMYAIDRFDQVASDPKVWEHAFETCMKNSITRISDDEMCDGILAEHRWNAKRMATNVSADTLLKCMSWCVFQNRPRSRDRFMDHLRVIAPLLGDDTRFAATVEALKMAALKNVTRIMDRIWNELAAVSPNGRLDLIKAVRHVLMLAQQTIPADALGQLIQLMEEDGEDGPVAERNISAYIGLYHRVLSRAEDGEESAWTKLYALYQSIA